METIKEYKKLLSKETIKFSKLAKNRGITPINYDDDLNAVSPEYDYLSEDFYYLLDEKLKENNITEEKDTKIYYRLGYCQGDGVGFYGEFEYRGVYFKVTHYGNYYHYNSKNISFDEVEDMSEEELNTIEEEFNMIYIDICKYLEKIGYEYIENTNKQYLDNYNLRMFFEDLNIDFDSWDYQIYTDEEVKKNINDYVQFTTNPSLYIKDFEITLKKYTQTTIEEFEEVEE